MKVLFVSNGLASGGAEKLLNDMLPILQKQIDVELLILHTREERYLSKLIANGVKVEVIPSDKQGHLARMKYIWNYIRKCRPDVVHANLFPPIYYCSILKKLHPRKFPKLIITEHNTDNRRRHLPMFRYIERFIYSSFETVISISKGTQDALLSWLGKSESAKYITISNGVPINVFNNALPIERQSLHNNLSDNDILLCMVGTLTPQKNHIFMIKVLKELPKQYKLVLVGEGSLYDEIKNFVEFNGLQDRVILLGYVNDVGAVMKTCDIVVIPSLWEGFGLISVEAMATGTPVVASDVSGLREIVDGAGLLAKKNDLQGFVDCIVSLQDKWKYDQCSRLGIERAKTYDIHNMSGQYLNVYKQILK